eukprot:4341910-Prymnesium_polylepis.1
MAALLEHARFWEMQLDGEEKQCAQLVGNSPAGEVGVVVWPNAAAADRYVHKTKMVVSLLEHCVEP